MRLGSKTTAAAATALIAATISNIGTVSADGIVIGTRELAYSTSDLLSKFPYVAYINGTLEAKPENVPWQCTFVAISPNVYLGSAACPAKFANDPNNALPRRIGSFPQSGDLSVKHVNISTIDNAMLLAKIDTVVSAPSTGVAPFSSIMLSSANLPSSLTFTPNSASAAVPDNWNLTSLEMLANPSTSRLNLATASVRRVILQSECDRLVQAAGLPTFGKSVSSSYVCTNSLVCNGGTGDILLMSESPVNGTETFRTVQGFYYASVAGNGTQTYACNDGTAVDVYVRPSAWTRELTSVTGLSADKLFFNPSGPPPRDSDATGLSAGAIAGIVIGAVALLALIALWFIRRRRSAHSKSRSGIIGPSGTVAAATASAAALVRPETASGKQSEHSRGFSSGSNAPPVLPVPASTKESFGEVVTHMFSFGRQKKSTLIISSPMMLDDESTGGSNNNATSTELSNLEKSHPLITTDYQYDLHEVRVPATPKSVAFVPEVIPVSQAVSASITSLPPATASTTIAVESVPAQNAISPINTVSDPAATAISSAPSNAAPTSPVDQATSPTDDRVTLIFYKSEDSHHSAASPNPQSVPLPEHHLPPAGTVADDGRRNTVTIEMVPLPDEDEPAQQTATPQPESHQQTLETQVETAAAQTTSTNAPVETVTDPSTSEQSNAL
ncbi:hypothetical protein GQ42DRAFT_165353 [Ramicandelaber brevisporus]|nr:hypothetical protein GQ42DRAFT_165353 [Ramicandelaber brevisporus]